MLWLVIVVCGIIISEASSNHVIESNITIDVSKRSQISPRFLGVFFEEINHAGTGGLWAELVNNRGFEKRGHILPMTISPWGVIGDENEISITTELTSCFKSNPVALRMDILCHHTTCPPRGVGVYNPGYWGMNIEEGQSYNVVFYLRSSDRLDLFISFVTGDGTQVLAFHRVTAEAKEVRNWTKMEITLQAKSSCAKSRLQLTTSQKGTIWVDQVSAMPNNTYMGHGFRSDLIEMIMRLKPKFLRFPGGCYIEGNYIDTAPRWKDSVGPWEERPGQFTYWGYWSDDGLGYLEYLQLAEDLGAEPVWVVNNGMSTQDRVDISEIAPFVQDMLDGIEFARGGVKSKWGSLRAKLGHPTPFRLKFVAVGNENCKNYKAYKEYYLKFYSALKSAYPDINVISNCNGWEWPLDYPTDLYDFHPYPNVSGMLRLADHLVKKQKRHPHGPKAFVSEYAVLNQEKKAKYGTFEGALAEAAFLLSLEQNSEVVDMVCYAPLFGNKHDRRWSTSAIIFNSDKVYGITSYWVQTLFTESSGAFILNVEFHNQRNLYITAISWSDEQHNYIKIKVVNFNYFPSKLKIAFNGLQPNTITTLRKKTELTSNDLQADNTFDNPTKVLPVSALLQKEVGKDIDLVVQPYSFTSFDMTYERRQS